MAIRNTTFTLLRQNIRSPATPRGQNRKQEAFMIAEGREGGCSAVHHRAERNETAALASFGEMNFHRIARKSRNLEAAHLPGPVTGPRAGGEHCKHLHAAALTQSVPSLTNCSLTVTECQPPASSSSPCQPCCRCYAGLPPPPSPPAPAVVKVSLGRMPPFYCINQRGTRKARGRKEGHRELHQLVGPHQSMH